MMKTIDIPVRPNNFPVAIVVSRFNSEITKPLLEGALERLREMGFTENNVTVVHVPGAIEIPIVAQRLAQRQIFDAILCLGAVIRGETDHYRYVCEQVSQGCQQIALQHDIPIIFGVLTTENEAQARERIGGKHGHKGKESVDAMLEIVGVLKEIG